MLAFVISMNTYISASVACRIVSSHFEGLLIRLLALRVKIDPFLPTGSQESRMIMPSHAGTRSERHLKPMLPPNCGTA